MVKGVVYELEISDFVVCPQPNCSRDCDFDESTRSHLRIKCTRGLLAWCLGMGFAGSLHRGGNCWHRRAHRTPLNTSQVVTRVGTSGFSGIATDEPL